MSPQASEILTDPSFLSFAHHSKPNARKSCNSMPVVSGLVLVGAKECFFLGYFKLLEAVWFMFETGLQCVDS